MMNLKKVDNKVKSKAETSVVKDKFKRELQKTYDILQQNLTEICNNYTEESLKESFGGSYQKTEEETLEKLQRIIKLTPNDFSEDKDVPGLLDMVETYVISTEKVVKSMKQVHNDYQNAMNKLRHNLEAQKREVSDKRIMIDKLQEDLKKQNHEIREKNLVIDQLDEDIKNQRTKFIEKNQMIENLAENIKNHKEQIGIKTQIISKVNEDIKSLKAKVAELENLIEKMDENSENHKREVAVLLVRIQTMEENNENHNRELAEMEKRIKTMEENSENHKREVADLKNYIQTMEEKSENHKRELAEKNNVIEKLRLEMEKNSNENEDKVFDLLETVETCVKAKLEDGESSDTCFTTNKEFLSPYELHMAMENTFSGIKATLEKDSDESKEQMFSLIEVVESCVKSILVKDGEDDGDDFFLSLEPIRDDSILQNKFPSKFGNIINGFKCTLEQLQNEKPSVTGKQKISGDMKNNDQTSQISDLESKIKKLEMQNEENQKIISELENKITSLEKQNANDEQYENLLTSLKNKKQEIRDKNIKLENVESKIEEYKIKIRKLEREIKLQKEELSEAKIELDESEKLKEDVEKKYKALLREKNKEMKTTDFENIEKHLDEIKSLKAALKKEETASRNKDNTIEELQLENENSKLATIKCKELEANLQKVKFESEARYKDMIKHNEEEMKKKTDAILIMREKMKAKSEQPPEPLEIKRLNGEIKRKDNEIEHLNEKYKNMNEAYEKLCNENDMAKKEINILKSDLDNIKRLNVSRRPSEIPNENMNIRNLEFNQFPSWWRTHMSS